MRVQYIQYMWLCTISYIRTFVVTTPQQPPPPLCLLLGLSLGVHFRGTGGQTTAPPCFTPSPPVSLYVYLDTLTLLLLEEISKYSTALYMCIAFTHGYTLEDGAILHLLTFDPTHTNQSCVINATVTG